MTENKRQDIMGINEELEKLIKEQRLARNSFRKRKSLGDLAREPESMRELAKIILERQTLIKELEEQREALNLKEAKMLEDNALIEHFDNPILKWLQKEIHRLEGIIGKLEIISSKGKQSNKYQISPEEMEEYMIIANYRNTDESRENGWTLSPKELAKQQAYQAGLATECRNRLTKNRGVPLIQGKGVEPLE